MTAFKSFQQNESSRECKERGDSRTIHVPLSILPIIQIVRLLPSMPFRLFAIHLSLQSPPLNHLVDFGPSNGSKRLLGDAVVDGFTLAPLFFLPQVHGLKGNGTAEKLVRELWLFVTLGVEFAVGRFGFV